MPPDSQDETFALQACQNAQIALVEVEGILRANKVPVCPAVANKIEGDRRACAAPATGNGCSDFARALAAVRDAIHRMIITLSTSREKHCRTWIGQSSSLRKPSSRERTGAASYENDDSRIHFVQESNMPKRNGATPEEASWSAARPCSCASCFLNKQKSKSGILRRETQSSTALPCIGAKPHVLSMMAEDEEHLPGQERRQNLVREGVVQVGHDEDCSSEELFNHHLASQESTILLSPELESQTMIEAGVADNLVADIAGRTDHEDLFLHALDQLDQHVCSLRKLNQKYLNNAREMCNNSLPPLLELDVCATLCDELVILLRSDCEIGSNPTLHIAGASFLKVGAVRHAIHLF
jgi:hypothetical protein